MIPLRIEGADVVMRAPDGMDSCRALAVRVIDGCYVSRWEPTPDEIEAIANGAPVELWCVGVQPPVALMVPADARAVSEGER